MVSVLSKGFTRRNGPFLRKVFITYTRPILEYASNVRTSYLIEHINASEKIQKHFTGRIHSLAHLTYPEHLAALDLDPLELRRLSFLF